MKQNKTLLFFILGPLILLAFLFGPEKASAAQTPKEALQNESAYVKKACANYLSSSLSKMNECITRERTAEYNKKVLSKESSSIQNACERYIESSKNDVLSCIRRQKGIKEGEEGVIILKLGKQPNIRVGILGTKSKIKITANGQFYIRDKSNKTLKTVAGNREIEISMSGSNYIVKGSGINLKTKSHLRFLPSRGTIMNVLSPKEYYHRFRNTIEVRKGGDGKLWVINELPLENYLAGLGELGNSGETEYVKTLGVAARTYAYYWEREGGRHPDKHFDLYDTESDQLYFGYDYEKKISRVVKIFKSVAGQIVTYKGKPIVAVYSSSSGGKTKEGPYPYLKSVKDPYGGKKRLGHGMGLSAKGALGYAEHGKTYKWILSHYYSGTKVGRAY